MPVPARRIASCVALLTALAPWPRLAAQREPVRDPAPRDPVPRERRIGGVPREVSLEVAQRFNMPTTRRVRGDLALAAGDTLRGDLAVLSGTVQLDGVVTGQVVVLNGDVRLGVQAHIGQGLTIIGGSLDEPAAAHVGGTVRVWGARFHYREDADTLVADPDGSGRWSRWARTEEDGVHRQLFVTSAHTYNRVEGLPILFGPRLAARAGTTRLNAELLAILRTGTGLALTRENLGHRARAEVRMGERRGAAVGMRLFDEVEAMERWPLTDAETGLQAFLFTRDYRDFWQRHGGQGYLSVFAGAGAELTAAVGEERWQARRARDVWSLVRRGTPWRENPAADEGVIRLATLSAVVDTRTSPTHPRSGWYVRGEIERGTGRLERLGALTPGVRATAPGPITYGRALVDLRRYNRLGPGTQVDLRAVLGGWIAGDQLPVQRRLAVSGIDALPGFDFRRLVDDVDVGGCATGGDAAYATLGRPAQCDRIVLVQAQWKRDIRLSLFGGDDLGDRRWAFGRKADGAWVLFANSGRGWLVGPATGTTAADRLRRPMRTVPTFGTWRTDVGGGFDFGDFGVYVAQAVSTPGLSPNVYLRLARRF